MKKRKRIFKTELYTLLDFIFLIGAENNAKKCLDQVVKKNIHKSKKSQIVCDVFYSNFKKVFSNNEKKGLDFLKDFHDTFYIDETFQLKNSSEILCKKLLEFDIQPDLVLPSNFSNIDCFFILNDMHELSNTYKSLLSKIEKNHMKHQK